VTTANPERSGDAKPTGLTESAGLPEKEEIKMETVRKNNWRMVSLLLASTMVGCAEMGEMAEDDTTLEEGALSTIEDGVCGASHNPDRDRDHKFHKRCEHYKHRRRYKRRKAGDAQLAVRALLDANKTAVLEATTGTFDDGSVPPGTIEKLVVWIPRPDGKRRDERIFKGRPKDGFFSTALGSLIHGQALTIDATISGISRGKDRISLDDQVLYRPDLTVGHIDLPPSVGFGVPTSIAATVREMKGDLGAKADCVLSVDGQTVDRVSGIWVDAGGVVTCHFSHTFASTGRHVVRVDVGNVMPGDYEVSNNGAAVTVDVAPQVAFSGDVCDATYAGSDLNEVIDNAGNVVYRNSNAWAGAIQSVSVNVSWQTPITFPLLTVAGTASSAGSTWPIVAVANVAADSADPTQGICAARSDATGFNWITVCTTGTAGPGATNVNVSTFAGDVTYHSEGACMQTTSFQECTAGFTWNDRTSSQDGTRRSFADAVAISINLSDASGTTLQASPSISLAPYTSQHAVPRTCEMLPDQMRHCFRQQYLETGVRGSQGL
jgi:hypothetical protein